MSADRDEQPTGLHCSGCEREVDLCAFCERTDWKQTICFRCLQNEIGQTKAHPHEHGG